MMIVKCVHCILKVIDGIYLVMLLSHKYVGKEFRAYC